jgi:Uncharacterized protein conserved in bacteria
MRFLLDTHVWLWLCRSPEKLSKHTRRHLLKEQNELLLSAASVWEIAIKYSIGKLPLPSPPGEYVLEGLTMTDTHPIAVQFSHAVRVARLPFHHYDPFDRLLIAQAQAEDLPIVTSDPQFKPYEVEIIPA